MSAAIHMETDIVDAVAKQMQRAAQDMENAIVQLQHEQYRLNNAWMGASAGVFTGDLQRVLQQLENEKAQLHDLGTRLATEVQEWLEADRHFGPGMASTASTTTASPASNVTPAVQQIQDRVCGQDQTCREKWSHPPRDAEDLAYQVMSLPKDMPYVIMDLGNGEYLVMLRGTTDNLSDSSGWFSDGTDWDQNAPAFLGIPNLYQNAVVAAILASVPPGAKLHFAGHSQGGMVAQNLAVDPRLKDYQMESVTMFGSPTTLAKMNPETKYVSYEINGDIVPRLDEEIWSRLPGGKAALAYTQYKQLHMERHLIPTPDGVKGVGAIHGAYNRPGVLTGQPLGFKPPQSQHWDCAQQGHRVAGVIDHAKATIAGFRRRRAVAGIGGSGSGSW